ncbi:MAG: hypothetical protein KF690_00325 [Bacteroidetes bacterium]|nr:hypothetical protein [Bacteroidota bacterium]
MKFTALRLPVALVCGFIVLALVLLAALPAGWWLQLGEQLFAGGTAHILLQQAFAPERREERCILALLGAGCWMALGLLAWRSSLWKRLPLAIVAAVRLPGRLWKRLPWWERCLFLTGLALLVLVRGYWAVSTPITYDEAYSYLNFTRQGPLVSLLYYPGTNNHPLFNALNALLPGIRWLPVLLGGMLVSVAYVWLRLRWHAVAAWGASLLLALTYPLLLYGIHARGYALMLFCSLLGFLCWDGVVRKGWHSLSHVVFAGCMVAGTWALPSMVFPLAGCYAAWLAAAFYGRLSLRGVWQSAGLVTLGICAYYLPLLALNGTQAFSQTGTLQDMRHAFSLPAFVQLVLDTFRWCWQAGVWIIPFYLAVLGFLAWRVAFRKDTWALLLFLQGMVWWMWVPLTGVLQFERTFCYLPLVFALGVGLALQEAWHKGARTAAWLGLLVIGGYVVWQSTRFESVLRKDYAEAYAARAFMQEYAAVSTPQVFASDAFYHNLKLAGYPGLQQPQQSWEAVRHTQARYVLAHARGDSLRLIPAVYQLIDSIPPLQVYRKEIR